MARKKTRGRKRTGSKRAARAGGRRGKRRGARKGGERPRYPAEFRKEVAEHSILHGIHAAAKHFGVSAPSVTTWRKAHGITRATKKAAQAGKKVRLATPAPSAGEARGYGEDFRREVAEYSILNGIQSAAKHYKVSMPSVTNWRKSFGISRKSKQEALASVASGAAPSAGMGSREKRELKKEFQRFARAFERALSRL